MRAARPTRRCGLTHKYRDHKYGRGCVLGFWGEEEVRGGDRNHARGDHGQVEDV